MDTEASLREYLKLQLKIPLVARIGPLAKAFDFVATAAPGVREILTVGKLCWEVRERHYDLVVVDAPASGHIVGQLAAPQAINDLVKVGLIRSQTDWMLDILSDPHQTGLVAVATPEEMPVSETLELAERVREETNGAHGRRGGQPGAARAVRPARGGDLRAAARSPRLKAVLSERAGGSVAPVLEAARLAVTMRRTRSSTWSACRPGCPTGVPVLLLPYLFFRSFGLRTTRQVAAVALGEELGCDGAPSAPAAEDDRRSCSRPRRSSSPADRAAWAKRPRPRRWPPWRPREHGGRVLVLTVDPARRLADALGLEGHRQRRGPHPRRGVRRRRRSPRGASCGPPCSTPSRAGTPWSARHAPDAATREQILANPLYQNISGRFVQCHDYIAMERLYEIHAEGKYDLIVVDTPPTRNALDFLEAPAAHGRLLLVPAAALADRALPLPVGELGRHGPSTRWPTGSSARSSWPISPSSSSSSSPCTTGSSSGPRR